MQSTRHAKTRADSDVWKGIAAGLVAGLVASWTMNRFQDVWSKLAKSIKLAPDKQFQNIWSESPGGVDESSDAKDSKLSSPPEVQDDTTERAASVISERLFEHKLTQAEKKIAGTAVHYILGTSVGGLYGAAAEVAPQVTAGAGLPFGAVFWATVDEGAVPLLGLSKGPTAYPFGTHAYALSSHLVYGLTAELLRRALRSAM